MTLYSEDIAGNVNENIDESKEAEISFGVDKTAPVVIPIDVESNAQYPVDTKAANVTVNDNLVLDSVEIYIGDKNVIIQWMVKTISSISQTIRKTGCHNYGCGCSWQ